MNAHDPLVDVDRLNAWIRSAGVPGDGDVVAVDDLPGGAQNLLYVLRRADGTELVLRRPGRHAGPEAATSFQRESRALAALAGTAVPHPRLHASCADPEVIGAPFSVLEKIEGFTPKGRLPGTYATDPQWRRSMALELVDGAATLASVDPVKAGLGDPSRLEGWPERQVSRYRAMLEGYRESAEYRAAEAPGVDGVAAWLGEHRPAAATAGIVHGDLQFANVMFEHGAPRLAAIVDWEMASLGDPLLDLAWILTAWREDGDPPGSEPYLRPWDGIPGRAELVARYAERTGRDVSGFRWFQVLACFRLAALLEGTYVRALNGRMDRATGEGLHAYARWLWAKAAQEIAGG
ncbi:phosphotransferase family protein [Actinomadura parmotrematis]|uniref:Phosphotransferase family protein n=1 Tax=Actinomadura parmotrematis TaxID=2864039 RepID=A0ABS7FQF3_9ACTN|nr:phosphotransferase family protein [Actinomadura parmotrematis]MBW8482630.1 phosphotransferase family protein [Actinomadura parmotrematis]